MASNAYLTIKGQKQGDIKGGVTIKGREGSILVHAFSHEVISPRDPASGLPTGKRQHQPFSIVKEIDASSPRLWSALVSNEVLVTWDLKIGNPAIATGVETEIYTITLTNANIASIREFMVDNEDPALAKFPVREEISFTYQKIQWVWADGGVSAGDDWDIAKV